MTMTRQAVPPRCALPGLKRAIQSLARTLALPAILLTTGCGGSPDPATAPAAPPPVTASQQPAPQAPPHAPTAGQSSAPAARFDREWAPYFPPSALAYGAARDLSFYNPSFGGVADPKAIRELRARLSARSRGATFADWLQEINDFLIDKKSVQVSFLELFERGFAFGAEHDAAQPDSEPTLTLLAVANDKLTAFADAFEKHAAATCELQSRDLAGGKLTTIRHKGRPATLTWWRSPKLFLAANGTAAVEAALARGAKGSGGVESTPGYAQAAARLDPDAAALLVLNPARLAENVKNDPAFSAPPSPPSSAPTTGADPAAMAAALAGNARPRERVLETLSNLSTLWGQLVARESQYAFDFHAGFDASGGAFPTLAAGAPAKPLASPGLPSVNNPLFLAASLQKDSGAPAGDAAAAEKLEAQRQMKASVAMMMGLDYELDVQPWLGSELAASVLWDDKFPQLALMVAADDPEACKKTMQRVAANFKGKLDFEEKTAGEQKLYVASQSGKPQVTPAWTVAGGFLILATGQQVVESLLDSPQKLKDSPGFASLYSTMKADRLQFAAVLSTDALERVAELAGPDSEALQKQMQAACIANLPHIQSGKLPTASAICPAGGAYERENGSAACSLHGTEKQPRPLPPASNPQVAAARQLSGAIATVAAGGALVEPGLYRVTVVFRRR
ncbi:MAG: DUF3352 domain-containing protein [Candidatus Wallbacteria bacterium]|nr:DUF3352 domain-containing protein [Candidatus Wallbacteria bacterium]